MTRLQPFNLMTWIDEHRDFLRPPVGNAQIWRDTDFMVTIVGGPNVRTDYHDDPTEEFFYQLEGDMVLRIIEGGRPKDLPIRAGEVLLLPPHVRHSPQRPEAGSLCLLVERTRPRDLLDGFEWFCPSCHNLLHRVEAHVSDLGTQLPQAFDAFHADTARRTCKRCGTLHPGK